MVLGIIAVPILYLLLGVMKVFRMFGFFKIAYGKFKRTMFWS